MSSDIWYFIGIALAGIFAIGGIGLGIWIWIDAKQSPKSRVSLLDIEQEARSKEATTAATVEAANDPDSGDSFFSLDDEPSTSLPSPKPLPSSITSGEKSLPAPESRRSRKIRPAPTDADADTSSTTRGRRALPDATPVKTPGSFVSTAPVRTQSVAPARGIEHAEDNAISAELLNRKKNQKPAFSWDDEED